MIRRPRRGTALLYLLGGACLAFGMVLGVRALWGHPVFDTGDGSLLDSGGFIQWLIGKLPVRVQGAVLLAGDASVAVPLWREYTVASGRKGALEYVETDERLELFERVQGRAIHAPLAVLRAGADVRLTVRPGARSNLGIMRNWSAVLTAYGHRAAAVRITGKSEAIFRRTSLVPLREAIERQGGSITARGTLAQELLSPPRG